MWYSPEQVTNFMMGATIVGIAYGIFVGWFLNKNKALKAYLSSIMSAEEVALFWSMIQFCLTNSQRDKARDYLRSKITEKQYKIYKDMGGDF